MMLNNVTPEKAIAFVRLSVALTCCWPVSSQATEPQVTRFKLLRSVALVNATLLLLPLIYSSYTYRNDPLNFSKAISMFLAVLTIFLQTSVCVFQYDRFQGLIDQMYACCEKAKSYERYTFQRYVDKYSTFYGASAIWCYATAASIVLGTLFLPQPFPTNAKYPFRVDYEPLRSIVFLQQALVGLQGAAHVCISIFSALLLLFAAARFENLKIELRGVKASKELIKCMKKYRIVRRYAKDVVIAFRYIVFSVVILCGLVLLCTGINFIERQPFTVQVQFLFLGGAALGKVFMCAWPADHLLEASENVMQGIYESTWYQQSTSMQKDVAFMLLPQAPIAIRIQCIIPVLSLDYYCSFISNVFSIFTLLRVAIKDE